MLLSKIAAVFYYFVSPRNRDLLKNFATYFLIITYAGLAVAELKASDSSIPVI